MRRGGFLEDLRVTRAELTLCCNRNKDARENSSNNRAFPRGENLAGIYIRFQEADTHIRLHRGRYLGYTRCFWEGKHYMPCMQREAWENCCISRRTQCLESTLRFSFG